MDDKVRVRDEIFRECAAVVDLDPCKNMASQYKTSQADGAKPSALDRMNMTDLRGQDQQRARLSSAYHAGRSTRSPRQFQKSQTQKLLRRAFRTVHSSLT